MREVFRLTGLFLGALPLVATVVHNMSQVLHPMTTAIAVGIALFELIYELTRRFFTETNERCPLLTLIAGCGAATWFVGLFLPIVVSEIGYVIYFCASVAKALIRVVTRHA